MKHSLISRASRADIRIGTRTDKQGSLAAKVSSVKDMLKWAQSGSTPAPPLALTLGLFTQG